MVKWWMVSLFTLLRVNAIPLCNQRNILDGVWVPYHLYHSTLHCLNSSSKCVDWKPADFVANAFQSCPGAMTRLVADPVVSYQVPKYACVDYTKAIWKTRKCSFLAIEKHLQLISHSPLKNPVAVVVGDSLLGQLYVAATCLMEYYNGSISWHYFQDRLLRADVPCEDACLTLDKEEIRRRANETIYLNACNGCLDGIRHSLQEFDFNTKWLKRLPMDTKMLVIGTGAWYNGLKMSNSTLLYEETLLFISPILRTLIEDRKIEVFWVSLPPMVALDLSVENSYLEWHSFATKNRVARSILEPLGVHFIDIESILAPLKVFDRRISSDGLHWWYGYCKTIVLFYSNASVSSFLQ